MDNSRPRIAVIDDDRNALYLINVYFQYWANIDIFPSALGFLREIGTNGRPDIIITDLKFKSDDATGFDIIDCIKGSSEFGDIPIFVLTCWPNQEFEKKCLKMGAEEYFTKPIREPDEFVNYIMDFIKENNYAKSKA